MFRILIKESFHVFVVFLLLQILPNPCDSWFWQTLFYGRIKVARLQTPVSFALLSKLSKGAATWPSNWGPSYLYYSLPCIVLTGGWRMWWHQISPRFLDWNLDALLVNLLTLVKPSFQKIQLDNPTAIPCDTLLHVIITTLTADQGILRCAHTKDRGSIRPPCMLCQVWLLCREGGRLQLLFF